MERSHCPKQLEKACTQHRRPTSQHVQRYQSFFLKANFLTLTTVDYKFSHLLMVQWKTLVEEEKSCFLLVNTITGFSCFAFFSQCVKGYLVLQNVFLYYPVFSLVSTEDHRTKENTFWSKLIEFLYLGHPAVLLYILFWKICHGEFLTVCDWML